MGPWEALIRTVGSLLKTFDRELQDGGSLPLTWYDVLIQLFAAPDGRMRMQTLADLVVLSRSGLTRLVDRMEREGLVRREPSSEDRRGYYAIITQDGQKALQKAQPIHEDGIYEHFTRHLDEADLEALLTAITKVRRANRM